MKTQGRRPHAALVLLFMLLYPAMSFLVQYLPNPFVPDAIIALNMIVPALAGFFFGPISGAVCGGAGTAISAFVHVDIYDILATFPHACMGGAAGYLGRRGNEYRTALALFVGHFLNICFYIRFGLVTFPVDDLENKLIGLVSEITIDIAVFILVATLFKKKLYCTQRI